MVSWSSWVEMQKTQVGVLVCGPVALSQNAGGGIAPKDTSAEIGPCEWNVFCIQSKGLLSSSYLSKQWIWLTAFVSPVYTIHHERWNAS